MNSAISNSLLIGILASIGFLTLPAFAQGIVPGLIDDQSIPPAPARPGVASGFKLFNPAELKLPIPAGMRPVPQWTPEFMKGGGGLANTVNPGTVLSGILEETISSNSSKAGDVFCLRLEEGLVLNGVEIIPKQSKVLGTITSCKPARMQHNGLPGTVDVSLQTLVFPDGRSTRLYAFVDHNPAMDMKQKPGTGNMLQGPLNTCKASVYSVFGAINSKAGLPLSMPKLRMGAEFEVKRGELLPIRLNRVLELANMTPSPMVPDTAMVPVSGQFGHGAAPMVAPARQPVPVGEKATAGLLPGLEDPTSAFMAPVTTMPQKDLPDPF